MSKSTGTCDHCGASITGRPRQWCYSCLPPYGSIPKREYTRIAVRLDAFKRTGRHTMCCGERWKPAPKAPRPEPTRLRFVGSCRRPHCNNLVIGTRYCAKRCRNQAGAITRGERPIAEAPDLRRARPAPKPPRKPDLPKCRYCDATVARPAMVQCSECKAAKLNVREWQSIWRRNRRTTSAGDYTAPSVFVRDKWTCQLCGEPIPKRARYPHPDSAQVDHIVPLSKGGEDRASNVQATHRRCNMAKGNREWDRGEQLRLVG